VPLEERGDLTGDPGACAARSPPSHSGTLSSVDHDARDGGAARIEQTQRRSETLRDEELSR